MQVMNCLFLNVQETHAKIAITFPIAQFFNCYLHHSSRKDAEVEQINYCVRVLPCAAHYHNISIVIKVEKH